MNRQDFYNILIVGDSRIRNLNYYLANSTLNLQFYVKCLPGAKLDQLMLKAMANLSSYDDISMVILIGGINNITWHATLRHYRQNEICDSVMQELYRITDRIIGISGIPVAFATLPGMSLSAYAPQMEYRLAPLQGILDDAVIEINRRICGLNRLRYLNTPDLAYPVHRCVGRRGRYYSHYSFLYDGLHPGPVLLDKWATKLFEFCALTFKHVWHVQDRVPPNF